MRILAVDVGTGTQDILLFDTDLEPENCFKMVMPSPTMAVARRIRSGTVQVNGGIYYGADAPFGTIRATMPAGASVESVQMQDGSALVHLSLPDGGAQIMVFRLSDGHQTGTIELQPQPQH